LDHVKPHEICDAMVDAGVAKTKSSVRNMLIKGFLSGALLAYATVLAITATIQTGVPLVGALVFPVGFVMIVLLGLELLTGNFALVPMARLSGRADMGRVLRNFGWVFLANLIGSVFFGVLLYCTMAHDGAPAPLAAKIIAAAEAKTTGYAASGAAGMLAVFVKAIMCNWMVTLGVVMAMASTSTIGKLLGAWLPIFTFFALGYEHLVVNFFLIPTGMILGAKVTLPDWLMWNMLPVTIGNLVGGFVFTGLAFYLTRSNIAPASQLAPAANALKAPVSSIA